MRIAIAAAVAAASEKASEHRAVMLPDVCVNARVQRVLTDGRMLTSLKSGMVAR
jgi:hypothetical protein